NEEFAATIDWGLRIVNLLGWPAFVGLVVLAQPIIMALFMRGEFTETTVMQVSYALYAYLCGLLSFMFIKILAPGYYARQDTKTPVKIGVIAMVANMAFNLILVGPFGHVGLAMATTLSAALNAFLLWHGLRKRSLHQFNSDWIKPCFAILLGVSCLAGLLLWHNALAVDWTQLPDLERVWRIALVVIAGVLVYFAGLFLGGFRPRMLKA
ncbi:MAG: murein biosynthesis integral membrane protein MurJ, partial [Marinomonas sp.]